MTVNAILQHVDELTPTERDEVISRLLDRYAPAVGMSPELAALLDARVADADADPEAVCTWDEVVAYVKRPR